MPRPKSLDPKVRVHLYLPESLIGQLQLRFYDPLRGRAEHGRISELVLRALREYLAREREKQQNDAGRY